MPCRMRFLVNPWFVFLATWITVLLGMSLRWSDLIINMSTEAYFLILSCILAAICANLCVKISPVRSCRKSECLINNRRKRVLIWFFLFGSVFEFLIERNLPLISLFYGSFILYTEYGIGGLHGLLNSLQLVLFSIYLYEFLQQGDGKKKFLVLIALVFWSALLMSRGMIMMQAFHGLILYISVRKVSFKLIAKLLVAITSLISVFIIMGNSRVKGGYDINQLAQVNDNFPSPIPDGVIWVYLYFVTPFNNVVNSLSGYDSVRYYPYNTLIYPLPNFFKSYFTIDSDKFITLVNPNLNVSSFFDSVYPDFGLEFSWLYIFGYFFVFSLNFKKLSYSTRAVLLNSCFCTMAFFSMFTNSFAMLILLFEVLTIFFVTQWKFKRDEKKVF